MSTWARTDTPRCRGCEASISGSYKYCPHCGLFVLRRGARVYQPSHFDSGPLRRAFRFACSAALLIAWSLLCLWLGSALARGQLLPPPPAGG